MLYDYNPKSFTIDKFLDNFMYLCINIISRYYKIISFVFFVLPLFLTFLVLKFHFVINFVFLQFLKFNCRVVKEEIVEDDSPLPCFNGRVVSWVS